MAAPTGQQVSGVENMIYMQSGSALNGGQMNLNVCFEIGTDPDQATIDVNNRVAAMAQLPEEVKKGSRCARSPPLHPAGDHPAITQRFLIPPFCRTTPCSTSSTSSGGFPASGTPPCSAAPTTIGSGCARPAGPASSPRAT